jgi:membrane protein DedA with SNARE-associated domain
MKRKITYASLIGLTLGTAFFGYCGYIVVTEVVATPRAGHYFGALLGPVIFLTLLIRQMIYIRRQRRCRAETTNGVPNHVPEGTDRKRAAPQR